MWQTVLKFLLQNVVPLILERVIQDLNTPGVTEGMVRDFEQKVGVPIVKRTKRNTKRLLKANKIKG